jgi:hypothetical protein
VGAFGRPAPPQMASVGLGIVKLGRLVLAGLLASCSGSNLPATIAAPPESFVELKQKIALIRDLPFKREVSLANASPNPAATAVDRPSVEEYAEPSLSHLSRVYKRLGLLPGSTDFARALADYSRLQRLFYYDLRKQVVVIAADSTKLAPAVGGETNGRTAQIPAVLSLTQALQEQYFQWQEKLTLIPLEDRKLAFRAVAAGDSSLVASAYVGEPRPTKTRDRALIIERWATVLEKMSAELPELLRQKLIFPYREGRQFVQWAHAVKGWEGVNRLYTDPPLSTSQVIHAEKYYSKRENPVRIIPWGLTRQMKEPAVVDQTLGEHLIQVLLASGIPRQQAAEIAAGSTGDQLTAYPHGEDLLTAWITGWKNETAARVFSRAYRTLLERHHRLRFVASPGRDDSWQAGPSGGPSMLLQTRGPFVLLLDGLTAAQALTVADEIWTNLDAETESIVIPFESAKRAAQLSWTSR